MVKNNLLPGGLNYLSDNSVVIDDDNIAWQKRDGKWVAYGKKPKDAFDLWKTCGPIALAWKQ